MLRVAFTYMGAAGDAGWQFIDDSGEALTLFQNPDGLLGSGSLRVGGRYILGLEKFGEHETRVRILDEDRTQNVSLEGHE